MEYLKLAADNGYAEAQYRMGLYFQNGEGGQKDVIQAAYWYQKANLQGHVRAKTKLDECVADMPLTKRLKWDLQKKREARDGSCSVNCQMRQKEADIWNKDSKDE